MFTSRNSVNHRQGACDFVGEPVGVTGDQRERKIQLVTELRDGIVSRISLANVNDLYQRPRVLLCGRINTQ